MLSTYEVSNYDPPAALLQNKTILITGAAGALGSALSMKAAQLGSELVLLDKNERALNKLFDEILDLTGKEAGLYPLDLSGATTDDYHTLAGTVAAEFNALHGLIHCAAELGQLAPFSNTDPSQWQKTLTSNLHGPVFLTSALLPLLKQSSPSTIIFTLDAKRKAYWNSYAAAKAALASVVGTLADELDADKDEVGKPRVTCNAVQPHPMRSSIRSSAFPGEDPMSLPTASENIWPYFLLLSTAARDLNGRLIDLQKN